MAQRFGKCASFTVERLTCSQIGWCSLWFRQTNIVWVGYAGGVWFLQHYRSPLWSLALALVPYAVCGVTFIAFLVWNGGVVLGKLRMSCEGS